MSSESILINFLNKYGRCVRHFSTALFPPVICKDGVYLSIQAGQHYSSYPRKDLKNNEYETVELYSSEEVIEDELRIYTTSDGTYGNVPVAEIDRIITKHGGINYDRVESIIAEEQKQ